MAAHPLTIVVVAGGPGVRLGAGLPKALVELAGKPILLHCLTAIGAATTSDSGRRDAVEVVVVAPASRLREIGKLIGQQSWPWPARVVAGGAERQDSVRAGLRACPGAATVVIHDTARPFLPTRVLCNVLEAAADCGAAIAALPAVDTVKLVDTSRRVLSTPERDRTWLAQTPQAFRREVLLSAHDRAARNTATDDAALVEAYGQRVQVIEGDPILRKITTKNDLRWAEWVLDSGQWPR